MSVELGTEKMLMRVYVEREHALKISQCYDAQHSLQELSLLSSSNTVRYSFRPMTLALPAMASVRPAHLSLFSV